MCKVVFKALTSPTSRRTPAHYATSPCVADPGTLFHAVYPAPTFTLWTGTSPSS